MTNRAAPYYFVLPHLTLLIVLALQTLSCRQQNPSQPETSRPGNAASGVPASVSSPGFRFPQMEPVTGGTVQNNWCLGSFDQAVIINAEKTNENRRYFYVGQGVTKIAIGWSGLLTGFLLKPAGNGVIEVFHGGHFPECLSMPSNFSLAEGGRVVQYRNSQGLNFKLDLHIEKGFDVVTVEFPENGQYSMLATHCSNCE